MDERDYSTSPDPIVLPSSPPSAHVHYQADGRRTTRGKSPIKSFVIHTPAARGQSPLKIRLTVEPEPDAEHDRPSSKRPRRSHTGVTRHDTPSQRASRPSQARQHDSDHAIRKRKRSDHDDRLPNGSPRASKAMRKQPLGRASMATSSNLASEATHDGGNPGDSTVANEDFTMISGDSLASIKANNSLLLNRERVTKQRDPNIDPNLDQYPSAITYPDLEPELELAMQTPLVEDAETPAQSKHSRVSASMSTGKHGGAAVSQKANTREGRQSDALMSDIWAEEASRSIVDDAGATKLDQPPVSLTGLRSDELMPPPRAKIPKSWRHATGLDINYSDSPVQPEPSSQLVKASSIDKSTSVAAAAMLSPPSTDEYAAAENASDDEDDYHVNQFDDSEITNPDAVATQLQSHEPAERPSARKLLTPRLPVSHAHSPSADETGLFWRTNRQTLFARRPQRPRHQKETLPDLGRILNASTPAGARQAARLETPAMRSQAVAESPASSVRELAVAQALREADHIAKERAASRAAVTTAPANRSGEQSQAAQGSNSRKLESQPREQPGHYSGPPAQSKPPSQVPPAKKNAARSYGRTYFRKPAKETAIEESFESSQDVSHSYEEHLNRMSPGKVRVNFSGAQDDVTQNDRLKPSQAYPSLFNEEPTKLGVSESGDETDDEEMLAGNRGTTPAQDDQPREGFFAMISRGFWAMVSKPPKPDELISDHIDEPSFPPTLRAKIRGRYGVVPEQHPWTVWHMRVLHRMVRSVVTHGADSMIPTTLRLPHFLDDLIDTDQFVVEPGTFRFTFEHACALWAFMQVVVPVSLIRAMERGEVEWLGDEITQTYRGRIAGTSTLGSELCFQELTTPEGVIDWQFLVPCVGSIVFTDRALSKQEQPLRE